MEIFIEDFTKLSGGGDILFKYDDEEFKYIFIKFLEKRDIEYAINFFNRNNYTIKNSIEFEKSMLSSLHNIGCVFLVVPATKAQDEIRMSNALGTHYRSLIMYGSDLARYNEHCELIVLSR